MKTASKNNINAESSTSRKSFFKRPAEQSFFPNVQTKLTVGQPGDKYEVEADAMADKVVQRLQQPDTDAHTPFFQSFQGNTALQTKCDTCDHEQEIQSETEESVDDEMLQTSLLNADAHTLQCSCSSCQPDMQLRTATDDLAHDSYSNTSDLENQLTNYNGNGNSLPENTRNSMEDAFGSDFSSVRVHTGGNAIQMNQQLNAQAFTHGNDVYFNEGKYDPQSSTGQHLLAHELTHVVQQNGVQRKMIQRDCYPVETGGRMSRMYCPEAAAPTERCDASDREINSEEFTPVGQLPNFYTVRLPNITLIEGKSLGQKSITPVDIGATLFSIPTEIGVILQLNGNLRVELSCSAMLEPVVFRNITIGKSRCQMNDFSMRQGLRFHFLTSDRSSTLETYRGSSEDLGQFIGNAEVEMGVQLNGSLRATAELEAEATFADIFDLASIAAGLEANASISLNPRLRNTLEFGLDDDGFFLNKHFGFINDTNLNFGLGASLRAEILGWQFLHETLPLVERSLSHNLTLGQQASLSSNGGSRITPDLDLNDAVEQFRSLRDQINQIVEVASEVRVTGGAGGTLLYGLTVPRIEKDRHWAERGDDYDSSMGSRMTNKRADPNVGYSSFDDFRGSNVAVFKYYIVPSGELDVGDNRIEEGYVVDVNDRAGLHSEAKIMGKLGPKQRAAGPRTVLFVEQIISERSPCGSCQSFLRRRNEASSPIRTKNADVFYVVHYSGNWIARNRALMVKYGLDPPPLADLRRDYSGHGRNPDPH